MTQEDALLTYRVPTYTHGGTYLYIVKHPLFEEKITLIIRPPSTKTWINIFVRLSILIYLGRYKHMDLVGAISVGKNNVFKYLQDSIKVNP